MIIEKKKLELFEEWRIESIILLSESKIEKNEFLDRNYRFLVNLGLKPFSTIMNLQEAIYNYQYYNIMAKFANTRAFELQNSPKKKKLYTRFINDRENYYYLKDLATESIIDFVENENIVSYFINLRSKRLTGQIFEIYIKSCDSLILHSKNKKILDKLKARNVFCEEVRESLIDSYVNKSY
ncbi:DUF6648 family protein [uncultured Anaerococcus sp.]|uniref:DUF6648 family protein n=1 Tax=uncultured Anaerococcus sp. TaxID=293428 RepID=UPI0028893180|nr:DUF6648 family protein [uncultured Anaerococcus sp.]